MRVRVAIDVGIEIAQGLAQLGLHDLVDGVQALRAVQPHNDDAVARPLEFQRARHGHTVIVMRLSAEKNNLLLQSEAILGVGWRSRGETMSGRGRPAPLRAARIPCARRRSRLGRTRVA